MRYVVVLFQAEDGIRDVAVTGVQTCALPISPLAVCDSRTVVAEDLVPSDLVYKERVGETYSVRYNPAHQWYYVPEMRRDEALLLKIADTRTDRARFMPHTGFTDPATPPDAMPRESIELRSLVFHPA